MSYTLYNIPQHTKGLIFDIDGTLYKNDAFCAEQGDCQIRAWADMLHISHEEGRRRVEEAQQKFAAEHDGHRTSLATIMQGFGIPIEQCMEWRRTLINPTGWLEPDPALQKALAELKKRFPIIALTNNSYHTGQKHLAVLGITDCFDTLLGLEQTKKGKPDPAGFQMAADTLHLSPDTIVSIGDRYDVDIVPALSLGMGGILVDGPEIIPIIQQLIV